MENTNTKNVLQKLVESFGQSSTITKVYGEPVTANGKTIITVAKVAQGFGGGFGQGKTKEDASAGEGGGMGGGMRITPVGFIEISDRASRFIRFDNLNHLALGAAIGFGLFALLTPNLKKIEKGKKEKKKKK